MPSALQEREVFLFYDKVQDIQFRVKLLLPYSSPDYVNLVKIKDGQSLTLMAQIPA